MRQKIDCRHPGGHVFISRRAPQSLVFRVHTPLFLRARDIPGESGDAGAGAARLKIGFCRSS
jgi:hypothetical protein